MNIVLIGYRGTGKTTIAEKLGKRLSMRVVAMDEEIVNRAGKTIPEIVEEHGWDHFRDIESQVAADLAREDSLVIDAGGGVIVRRQNIENLKKNGIVFWLVADVETIISRIKHDDQRPSLSGSSSFLEEVSEILAERTPKYQAAADHVIDTAQKNVDEAIDAIAGIFSQAKEETA
ncbi:MAG: shikimate kinase [Candidatus Hydrogenedentota bacterium]|nr:MAG: shikimate kinase [Candidatus Hydrogenedentota bacterium]